MRAKRGMFLEANKLQFSKPQFGVKFEIPNLAGVFVNIFNVYIPIDLKNSNRVMLST